jgi:Putative peptidoglycan binding domain
MNKILTTLVALGAVALVGTGSAFAQSATTTMTSTMSMDFGTGLIAKGSTNSMAVMNIQKCLTKAGYEVSATGKFGSLTFSKVKAFQTANSIMSTGKVGSVTKPVLATKCGGAMASTTTVAGTPVVTTPGMTGTGEGTLSNFNRLGTYTNVKVMEGDKDKAVYGFEVMAKDADQQIDGLAVSFYNKNIVSTTSSSKKIGRYASDVSVWLDGKEIGRKVASSYSDDANDIYSYRFTGMKGVIKAGTKGNIVVGVTGTPSMDSNDASKEEWVVAAGFISGTSATTQAFTVSSSNSVSSVSPNGRYRDNGNSVTGSSSIDFQKAGTDSSDQKFKITTGTTNPVARTVQVSNTADTNEVTLLAFDAKAENSGMKVQRLPITLTVTDGGNGGVTLPANNTAIETSAVAKTVKLYANGTLITTETVPQATGSVAITFGSNSKLQYAIASNATVKFEVKADLNDIDTTGIPTTDFRNGDKIKAAVSASTAIVELDNVNEDTVSNKTGSSTGEDQTLRSAGVQVLMGTSTTEATPDQAGKILTRTFRVPLTISAFDETVHLSQSAVLAATVGAGNSASFSIEGSNGSVDTYFTAVNTNATFTSSDAPVQGSSFRIDAGTTKNFVLTVVTNGASTGSTQQVRVQMNDVKTYADSTLSEAGSATLAPAVVQSLTPSNSFETSFQALTK